MKNLPLYILATTFTMDILNAGILENTFDTAGNLTSDVINVPHDIVHGDENYRERRHSSSYRRHKKKNDSYDRDEEQIR